MRNQKVSYLTRLAVLVAIIVVLTVLNIGNIPIGPIVATIYHLPVIIGAIILGPGAGLILGGFWGLLGFILALTGNTTDIVALTIIQQSPLLYFVIAFFPRLIMGGLAGLTSRGFEKIFKKRRYLGYAFTGALSSLYNTIFYLGALWLLAAPVIAEIYEISLTAVGGIVIGVATTNGLVEAGVAAILVSAVCTALTKFLPYNSTQKAKT